MNKLTNGKSFFKKQLFLKLLFICYISCIGLVYLTSSTTAHFTSSQVHEQLITAGSWWDGSSLIFNESKESTIDHCGPVVLSVEVQNESSYGMYGTSVYEVYKVQEDGTETGIVSGNQMEIPMLGPGDSIEILYLAETPGDYIFKAYQRPEYDGPEQLVITSNVTSVICNEDAQLEDYDESASLEEQNEEENENSEDHHLPEVLPEQEDVSKEPSDDVSEEKHHGELIEAENEQQMIEEIVEGDDTNE